MAGPACQVYIRFMSADHAGTLGIKFPAGDQILHALCVIARAEAVFDVKLVGLHDLLAVDLDAQSALLGKVDAAVDACIGEGFLDGADCLQLLLRLQDAALELGKKNAP